MKGIKHRSEKAHSYSFILELGSQLNPLTRKMKRRQKRVTIEAPNKTEAGKIRTKMQHEIDTGIYVPPGKTTVQEYLESWLKDYCAPNLAANTTETYDIMVHKHLIPAIGNILLNDLKPQHIQQLYSAKLQSGRRDGKGGLSNRSVQYIHTTLNKALKSAVKMGIIARNPCDAVDAPKVKRHEFKVMNEEDINRFLEDAKKTEYYALFFCALFCGMRRSELLALKWTDVELLLMQVSVNRTLHHLNNGKTIISNPKTAKSKRMIALSPSTCAVLREHMEKRKQFLKSLNPKYDPDKDFNQNELVFCRIDGSPLLPDSVTHAWMVLARRNNLTGLNLHCARHTMASLMLKNGIHAKIVQERLGHASIKTTLDIYSHVVPGLQAAAANRLDDIVLKHEDKLTQEINALIKN